MQINPKIFRAYDIRGIYPQDFNTEVVYLISCAFVKFLKKPSVGTAGRLKIVVSRDNRLSSPALHKSLIKGITDMGADVIDIGLSTTPMLYFAVAHYGYDGGVIVTASHNPSQYNGFKMVRENALPISEASGIQEIKALTKSQFRAVKSKGRVIKKEVLKEYVDFNLKEIDKDNLKSLKIVIDTANAVSGIIIPEIFKKLPCKVDHLFEKSDGHFPNHPPDPLIEENLKTLQEEVKNKKADLGVAFDGDGDRIIFVNEKSKTIAGDLITALLSSLILKDRPRETILYDVRSSNIVREAIEKADGVPAVNRIGHSFIKERMRKENIIFAGEFSGHYYHRNHYFCEAPIFVLFKILEKLSKTSISQLIKPYQKYFHSGEINFRVKDKKKALKALEDKFSKDGKVLKIDGLRIDFKDWWFNARPSNTEPFLRLVVEAKTKNLMEQKTHILSNILHG